MNTAESLPIYVTRQDKNRLSTLIEDLKHDSFKSDELADLKNDLRRAITVEARHMPRNIVTMNSRVALIDVDTSERRIVTLVFPDGANLSDYKVSILSPAGFAMLGCRIGDELEANFDGETQRFVIEKVVYQPEAKARAHAYLPSLR